MISAWRPARRHDTVEGKQDSSKALEAYEDRWAGLLLVLSVAFLGVMLLEIKAPAAQRRLLAYIDWALWAVFLFDFIRRCQLSGNWRAYLREPMSVIDIVVLVSVPAGYAVQLSSWLGSARFLRAVSIVMRLVRGTTQMGRTAHRVNLFFSRRSARVIAGLVAVVAGVAWLEVWRFESVHPDSGIHTLPDALWWAVVTLFTVGYGDLYPHTTGGRVAGIVLMASGIALFGWLTACLASLFVEKEGQAAIEIDQDSIHAKLDELTAAVQRLESALRERDRAGDTRESGPD
jgi:voltage-gated potassium channel